MIKAKQFLFVVFRVMVYGLSKIRNPPSDDKRVQRRRWPLVGLLTPKSWIDRALGLFQIRFPGDEKAQREVDQTVPNQSAESR